MGKFWDYVKNNIFNPISACIFDLTLLCTDKKGVADFSKIDESIKRAYQRGLIDAETYRTLSSIGVDQMNYKFYIPTISEYERIVKKYFAIENVLYTDDVGSGNFPIYILKKK